MIRVCVVDDHSIVREGLKQVLSKHSDVVLVEEAASAEELLEKARTGRWDVTLLDLSMPGRGGLDVLRQLKTEHPRRGVLVLTMHSEDQYAVRVFKAGADGYLTKESVPGSLVDAIRTVAGGHKFISPRIAEKLALEIGAVSQKLPHERLSNREYEVMRSLARGVSVGEIAGGLGLSVKTISTNRARILKKMGFENNAELTGYAVRHKIIEDPSV